MTKTEAIKRARSEVSDIRGCPEQGYSFPTWDDACNAWREGVTSSYWGAMWNRSQALIDRARVNLGLPDLQYEGGNWTDYLV